MMCFCGHRFVVLYEKANLKVMFHKFWSTEQTFLEEQTRTRTTKTENVAVVMMSKRRRRQAKLDSSNLYSLDHSSVRSSSFDTCETSISR
jgi:hypothetical protein